MLLWRSVNQRTSTWSWWRARDSGSASVLKRGLVGAWTLELNSVLGTSIMGRCMYSARLVEPGPVPWGSNQTLPALLLEPLGLVKRTGAGLAP